MPFIINFNAANVRPNTGGFTLLDDGDYIVSIVSTDEIAAKSTPGASFIAVVMQVMDGPFKGERITDRLNLNNPNPQAVEIAYGTLSAICHVTNRIQIQTTAQLHGVPFKVRVVKRPRNDDESKFNNEIKAYMDMNGNPPGAGGGEAAPVQQVQQVQHVQPVQQAAPAYQAPPAGSISQQAVAAAAQPQFATQPAAAQPQFATQPAAAAPATNAAGAPSWAQG